MHNHKKSVVKWASFISCISKVSQRGVTVQIPLGRKQMIKPMNHHVSEQEHPSNCLALRSNTGGVVHIVPKKFGQSVRSAFNSIPLGNCKWNDALKVWYWKRYLCWYISPKEKIPKESFHIQCFMAWEDVLDFFFWEWVVIGTVSPLQWVLIKISEHGTVVILYLLVKVDPYSYESNGRC